MTAATPRRTVDVVIIARNEATRIAACIESVLSATASRFQDSRVVVVDSNSEDGTAAIAARYPVKVYRYRARRMTAAAGRWIGFQQTNARYVLFLDGDCELVPSWLELAVDTMDETPTAGVICGARQNAYLRPDGIELHDAGTDLGGTALYRSEALISTKGFNPFIIGGEEQELAARIEAHGFQLLATEALMSVHHTAPKESVPGIWRRYRSGMQSGPGQVLRISLADGLFIHHARRFDRYILTALYLVAGIAAVLVALEGHPAAFTDWVLIGLVVFMVLWWRRRSLHEAAFIAADWVSVAIGGIRAFFRTPPPREAFDYTLESIDDAETRIPSPPRAS
jgi:glycosyltransferase involved in cell wall biosynthesis